MFLKQLNKNMKNFADKKIIITGANGGIGNLLVEKIAQEKAKLILISKDENELQRTCQKLRDSGAKADYISADFSKIDNIQEIASIISQMDNISMIINAAGLMSFNSLGLESYENIEKIFNINLLAPIILSKALLPDMVKNKSGHIVNIGSIFGSIAFPYFSLYSSSKAGLKSFTEAMIRELDGSGVKFSYIAPRAVATKMNGGKINDYLKKTKANIDDANLVADKIITAIKCEKEFSYFGFPESLFVRLNYLCPKLVSLGIKQQSKIAKEILIKN